MNLGGALIIVLIGMLFFQFAFIMIEFQMIAKMDHQAKVAENRSQVSSEERERIIQQVDDTAQGVQNNSEAHKLLAADIKEIKAALNISS